MGGLRKGSASVADTFSASRGCPLTGASSVFSTLWLGMTMAEESHTYVNLRE